MSRCNLVVDGRPVVSGPSLVRLCSALPLQYDVYFRSANSFVFNFVLVHENIR